VKHDEDGSLFGRSIGPVGKWPTIVHHYLLFCEFKFDFFILFDVKHNIINQRSVIPGLPKPFDFFPNSEICKNSLRNTKSFKSSSFPKIYEPNPFFFSSKSYGYSMLYALRVIVTL